MLMRLALVLITEAAGRMVAVAGAVVSLMEEASEGTRPLGCLKILLGSQL